MTVLLIHRLNLTLTKASPPHQIDYCVKRVNKIKQDKIKSRTLQAINLEGQPPIAVRYGQT